MSKLITVLNTLEVQLRPLTDSQPIYLGKFFVPNPDQKLYAPQKFFELPQYRLHTDKSKENYAENLAKIASELSILEPI